MKPRTTARHPQSMPKAMSAASGWVDIPILLIAAAFFTLGLVGLGQPHQYYFDEGYYVPTAVRIGQGLDIMNREHPMLAKEMLAVWFQLFGVGAASWRMLSLLCGAIAIYAASMALEDRRTGRVFAALLALCGLSFAISRIALLEPYYLMYCALAAWAFSRRRYYASGVCFGLAIACKWSAAPLLACYCIAYAMVHRRRLLRGTLALLCVPAAVYLITFLPGLMLKNGLSLDEILPLQWAMLQRHEFVGSPHPDASHAWQWAIGRGTFWLLRGHNGILLAGNPVVMLAVLPAVAWGLWKRWPEAWIYIALMAFWELTPKQNQFLYHYMLPAAFGIAAVARIAARDRRIATMLLSASVASFGLMYPAYTGHPTPYHFKIWPDTESRLAPLTAPQEADFHKREQCLYHPAQCSP